MQPPDNNASSHRAKYYAQGEEEMVWKSKLRVERLYLRRLSGAGGGGVYSIVRGKILSTITADARR